jgi:DNA primase
VAVRKKVPPPTDPEPPDKPDQPASGSGSSAKKQILINPPLDFVLKDLDAEHPFFLEQGLEPRTVEHFGLGYCRRGLMKGRIVIPLHDSQGRLVGYAGRLADEDGAGTKRPKQLPKYLFPSDRERRSHPLLLP